MHPFLPQNFLDRMKELLGDDFEEFVTSYDSKHLCGLRANTLKLTPERFSELFPAPLERIPWIKNGFYYVDEEQPAKHPYYFAGMFYIQEPSAMTPASLLPVKPGDRVLDLCAAPGGKSTELGAKLKGEGVLVANDISNSRAKALLKNIELFGVRNAVVISEPPMKLTEKFEGYFDAVLVDAPCSGEGMFRKSHAIIKNWEQYGVEYYSKLQREILPQAVRMLRPGGHMIYSTCTFSPLENEGTLDFILSEFPDMHVVSAVADTGDTQVVMDGPYKGFTHAEPSFGGGQPGIRDAFRLYPHRVRGEGHFVALLKKDGESGEERCCSNSSSYGSEKYPNSFDRKRYKPISDEAFDFLERLGMKIDADRIEVRDDRLFLVPEGLPALSGLRIMRKGLLLGEMKKGRFEPSQALASALSSDEYDNVYNLSSGDSDVIRYLKCETITVPEDIKDGYVLVCVDGFPLGWGKKSGSNFKNKYLPGWRMM